MSTLWCRECRAWHAPTEHRSVWLVWCPRWHEEREYASRVPALDAADAAERWAENLDVDWAESARKGVTLAIEGPDGTGYTVELDGEVETTWYSNIVGEGET